MYTKFRAALFINARKWKQNKCLLCVCVYIYIKLYIKQLEYGVCMYPCINLSIPIGT